MGLLGDMFKTSAKAGLVMGSGLTQMVDNARTRKQIKGMYRSAYEENYKNRAVYAAPGVDQSKLLLSSGDDGDVYTLAASPNPGLGFLYGTSAEPESVVVSGGDADMRARASEPFFNKNQHAGVPVIALLGDLQAFRGVIDHNSVMCQFVSRTDLSFDAFRALPAQDIAHILFEAMADADESASPRVELLIQACVEVLLIRDGGLTFHSLALFTPESMIDELNALLAHHRLTGEEHARINRDYMAGSSEIPALRSFLARLNRQAEALFGKPHGAACNLRKVINQKGVFAIEVGAGGNDLLLRFLASLLHHYALLGRSFALVIDDVALGKYARIRDLFWGRTFQIGSRDLIASLHTGGENGEHLFTGIMGSVAKTVLFSHPSGFSCDQWSQYLGKYHKIRLTSSISQTTTLMGGNNTRGLNASEADEPRVRAETIKAMRGSLACITDGADILFAEV